jgi:predicted ATPase
LESAFEADSVAAIYTHIATHRWSSIVAHTWMDAFGGVRILATSRLPSEVSGEYLLRVAPLETTPAARQLTDSAALFRDRLGAACGSLNATDLAAVDELCTRLDGLPLAIELAATKTRTMTVPEIIARLDDRFGLLRGGPRDSQPRHQSLDAMPRWSWEHQHLATTARERWFGASQRQSAQLLAASIADIRLAFEWALTTDRRIAHADALFADLWLYWVGCGHLHEARTWAHLLWASPDLPVPVDPRLGLGRHRRPRGCAAPPAAMPRPCPVRRHRA